MTRLTPSQVIDINNQIAHLKDLIEYHREYKSHEYLAISHMYEELDMLRNKLEEDNN